VYNYCKKLGGGAKMSACTCLDKSRENECTYFDPRRTKKDRCVYRHKSNGVIIEDNNTPYRHCSNFFAQLGLDPPEKAEEEPEEKEVVEPKIFDFRGTTINYVIGLRKFN
jgi:hypothetical protein